MKIAAMLVLTAVLGAQNLYASQILPSMCTAEKLAVNARDVFCGICKGAEEKKSDKKTALANSWTAYTFEVTEVMKGDFKTGNTITFNQNSIRNMPMPSYDCGGQKEVCLFLSAPSVSGFRSPMGLACGKVDIVTGEKGTSNARVPLQSQDYFKFERPTSAKALTSHQKDVVTKADITRDDFISIIKAVVKDQQGAR